MLYEQFRGLMDIICYAVLHLQVVDHAMTSKHVPRMSQNTFNAERYQNAFASAKEKASFAAGCKYYMLGHRATLQTSSSAVHDWPGCNAGKPGSRCMRCRTKRSCSSPAGG